MRTWEKEKNQVWFPPTKSEYGDRRSLRRRGDKNLGPQDSERIQRHNLINDLDLKEAAKKQEIHLKTKTDSSEPSLE